MTAKHSMSWHSTAERSAHANHVAALHDLILQAGLQEVAIHVGYLQEDVDQNPLQSPGRLVLEALRCSLVGKSRDSQRLTEEILQ